MPRRFPRITFTDSVKRAQEDYGTRAKVARLETSERDDQRLGWTERAFLAARDSFYMASVNDEGWPYVQFRGGPPGFLKVLDERTLGYADFRGNMQLISTGNLRHDERVALILLDYALQRRLKILARATVHPAGERPDLVDALADPAYDAQVRRVVVLRVEAFDWNCPQHITPRFTLDEARALLAAGSDGDGARW